MRYLIMVAILLFSLSASASIGTVTELSGTAIINRKNLQLAVNLGTKIETDDKITAKNGRLKIRFNDDTTVSVTESSSLTVDDFVYSETTASKLGLTATSGTVRYVSGKIAHNNPKSVKINTPTATVAVRGTDFVMSVAESGESLIVLMPSCDIQYNINLKGSNCSAGIIDVTSGGVTVTLDIAYQATSVITSDSPPSKPVVLSLDNVAINNNLLLSSPRQSSDANIIAIRNAIEIDSVNTKQEINSRVSVDQIKSQLDYESMQRALSVSKYLLSLGITITDVSDNENVGKRYSDASETVQIGWVYDRISSSGGNHANIVLSLDTRALLVVTQDRFTDAYNSNMMSSRSYGTIIINQSRQ